MENENKNENKNKNKNRHHKRKSYFINPNGEQQKAPSEQSAEQKQSNNAPRSDKAEASAQTKKASPAVKTDSASNNTEKPQGQSKNKRNRNRRKKRSDAPKEVQPAAQDNISAASQPISGGSDTELAFPKFDRLEKPAQKKMESFSSSPEFQKYQDYQEFSYAEIYGIEEEPLVSTEADEKQSSEEPIESGAVTEVVGIRFKASGKTYYFAPNGLNLRVGIHAIVETSRGLEYGEVVMGNSFIPESETVPPLRPVVRAATQADTLHNEEIKKLEETAFRVCNEKIIAHELDMKLIDAQYTFDNSKLLFYFTSSGRVDFRELVKDLASVFRTRIELRQIGIRDEAKMVGGLGICGRPLCCSKFLTDFGQVSIKMAKEQNLSLNSAKISGICGRLMCCLRYEHDTYEYEIKRTPPVDTLVRTVDGVGTVTEISPLQGTIKVRLAATPEVQPKSYKREDVMILKKKN